MFKPPNTILEVAVLESGRSYKLLHSITYQYHGLLVTVPQYFVTDFVSIPRFFWRVLPPWDRHMKAAVLHDYIYKTPTVDISRKVADVIFLECMEELGISYWKRKFMYRAIRMFGRCSYKLRKQEADQL